MAPALRRGLVRATAAVVLATITVGLPAALVTFIGWPLPRTIPASGDLTGWLTTPLSDTVILNTLAVAAWLLWAAFLPAVAAEALAAHRGLPTPASGGRTGNPLRLGAAALITALTVGTLPAMAATTAVLGPTTTAPPVATPPVATPPVATPPVATPPVATQPVATQHLAAQHLDTVPAAATWTMLTGEGARTAQRGPATMHVGDARYAYVVERGDTLSGIAAAWLGDPGRWPQICRLNWHRHWPSVGGRLTDCDLIYPGWDLRLPHDATPPPGARPAPPTHQRGHGEPPSPSPASPPTSPTATAHPAAGAAMPSGQATTSRPAASTPAQAPPPTPGGTQAPTPSSIAGPLTPSGDRSPTPTSPTTRPPTTGPTTRPAATGATMTAPQPAPASASASASDSGTAAGTDPGARGQHPRTRRRPPGLRRTPTASPCPGGWGSCRGRSRPPSPPLWPWCGCNAAAVTPPTPSTMTPPTCPNPSCTSPRKWPATPTCPPTRT